MSNDHADIAQIEECGHERANQLLQAHDGYRLLGVFAKNGEVPRRQPNPGGGNSYIKHDIRYVVGRTAAAPPFPDVGMAQRQNGKEPEKARTPV